MLTLIRPFVALATLLSPLIAMAQNDDHPLRRSISVTGTGKVSAAPDVADISIGVVTQASTAQDALAANTEAMTKVHSVLKERGVAAKNIQTTSISVQPRYSQPPQPRPGQAVQEFVPRIVGYDVVNAVQITARDINNLGAILDAVVQTGANRIDGISFRISEPAKLLSVARKSAMADAKARADLLAGEAGVVVGLPISISEAAGFVPPQPMYRGRAMAMEAMAAPVPVAGGEQELSVNVSVVYELVPPK
jgi:uncharacterized protein YggE